MVNTTRNTLILIGLLVILIIFGYSNNLSIRQELKNNEEIKQKNIDRIKNLSANKEKLMNEYTKLDSIRKSREKLEPQKFDKLLLKEDKPQITYNYFLDIVDEFAPGVSFNFNFASSDMVGGVNSNSYQLVGTAAVDQLYKFVYNLENQQLFYRVEDLSVNSRNVSAQDTVSYNLTVRSFYAPSGIEPNEYSFKHFQIPHLGSNPFFSKIHSPVATNEKLLNIQEVKMIGLTPNKAFLEDSNGKISHITPGDAVQYGYFSYINWNKQQAVFKINKVGITQNIILELKKEEK